jgi:hypothetical protein
MPLRSVFAQVKPAQLKNKNTPLWQEKGAERPKKRSKIACSEEQLRPFTIAQNGC